MKFNRTLIILPVLLLIIFTACKKDNNNSNETMPVTADSVYPDKEYDVYDDGSGTQTQEIITYRYDNLKRLTTASDSARVGNNFILYSTNTLEYAGTDTLPYKLSTFASDGDSFDTTIIFYYYDASQQKIKDSMIISSLESGSVYSLSTEVTTYSFGAGKIFGYTVLNSIEPAGPAIFTRDSATLDANGNIINNKKYNVGGANPGLAVISNLTYDNHPAPYSRISALRASRIFPDADNFEVGYINNCLTQEHQVLLPSPYTVNGSTNFEYKTNGFPSVGNETYDGFQSQSIFTYKSL